MQYIIVYLPHTSSVYKISLKGNMQFFKLTIILKLGIHLCKNFNMTTVIILKHNNFACKCRSRIIGLIVMFVAEFQKLDAK